MNEKRSVKNQYSATFVVNTFLIGFGINVGWTSPSIILLTSDDTPLPSGKLTMDEASWVASLLRLGALTGSLTFGFVMERFGRKWPLIAMSFPMIAGWLLVISAQNVYYLYVARVLQGFVAGAILVVAPVYLIEISDDRIRGILASSVMLISNFGIVLAFAFGNYCSFVTTPIFMIMSTVLFVSVFSFYPESPTFLVKRNRINEAEKSIRFYHSLTERDEKWIQLEIQKLRNAIDGDKLKPRSSLKWSDLSTKPGSKAMTIGILLVLLYQFGGCAVIMNYTANILEEAGARFSPNMSALIVGVIQFLGSCLLTCFVDRIGRKFLYILSTSGAATGLITLGVYMMLKSWDYDVQPYNCIPLAGLSFVILFASFAILTLPFTLTAELMPENLKEFGTSSCTTLMLLVAFLISKYFPFLLDLLGFHTCMFLFGGVCFFGTLTIIFYVPETKGKSYEQIMNSLQ